ncbi:MAG: hypothetical protein KJP25_03415 [Gammaproteobacteria bacterium]|nr:hypothetical protein [Gammaproteobacteria bacterium]MBT8151787.1 hypothetical protein [Gammaproteobacteria bacterium]NND39335.1 hypothetical protein [Pseudomonadales bacterium]NNL11420.1 hypothetical protein [Pseudomonadales bacterium]
MHNEAGEKLEEIDVFDQIDEALEEREGSDRRKQDLGPQQSEEERRKNDRRDSAPHSA